MDLLYKMLPYAISAFFFLFVVYKLLLFIYDKKEKSVPVIVNLIFNVLMAIPFILVGIWVIYTGFNLKSLIEKVSFIIFGIFLIGLGISGTAWKDNRMGG